MKLESLDLNLLLVFDALATERSVTQAAAKIGLSQSALSNALARLRILFRDPLFERAAGQMQPTPREPAPAERPADLHSACGASTGQSQIYNADVCRDTARARHVSRQRAPGQH
jgi:hypothetical protein